MEKLLLLIEGVPLSLWMVECSCSCSSLNFVIPWYMSERWARLSVPVHRAYFCRYLATL